MWREDKFRLLQVIIKHHPLHIILLDFHNNQIINIINIDAPNSRIQRKLLWAECSSCNNLSHGLWLIGGDFNVTRYLGEHAPREGNLIDMEEFNDFINQITKSNRL